MQHKHIKIAAAVSAAVILSAVLVAIRMNLGGSGADGGNSAISENSKTRASGDRGASARPGLTYDQWTAKIRDTDLGEFRGLISSAMNIGDAELRNAVIVAILDRWMLEGPDDLIKYLASLEVNGEELAMASVALALQECLTKLTPERAASDEVLVIVHRLIDYLAEHDPDKALEWAKNWLLDDTQEHALVSIARSFARTDIGKSLAVIDQMKSPLRRSQALALVGAEWAKRDANAALTWALGLKIHSERAMTLNSVLMALASENPGAAASDLKSQAEMINEQYRKDRETEMSAAGISEADMANDPVSYKEMVDGGLIPPTTSPDVELMADAAKIIGSKLAEGGPAAAAEWALSLENDFLKFKSLAGVIEGWAVTDPAAAYRFLNENFPGNPDLVKSLYGSWAGKDLPAAVGGTNMITDPAQRSLALESVIKAAAANGNALEMVDYVNQLPADSVSDGVLAALANSLSYSSPQKAWEIAQGISNESAQFRAMKAAFSALVIQDAAQAGALLESTTLSSSTSERLRDVLDAVVGN